MSNIWFYVLCLCTNVASWVMIVVGLQTFFGMSYSSIYFGIGFFAVVLAAVTLWVM
jgi:hypothetical protein